VVESYYEVQLNVPVGDLPRSADLVLLRRTQAAPPFVGIWRHLTPWSVLEFKGPSVAPRLRDLKRLVELGLGIDRRLRESATDPDQERLPEGEVSFWYLANHAGRGMVAEGERLFRQASTVLGDGLWQWRALGEHPFFLVSRDQLPLDLEGAPLHLLSRQSEERGRELAQVLLADPEQWAHYQAWFAFCFPELWPEVQQMTQATKPLPGWDFGSLAEVVGVRPLIESIGLKWVVQEVGVQRVIQEVGLQRVIQEIGLPNFIAQLTPEQREILKQALAGGDEAGPTT